MKKVLLFAASLLLTASMFAQGEIRCADQNARETKGATKGMLTSGTFTNFTATDMSGNSHDIQAYLSQGKYVVIDFFCAWCGPCWSYHQSGILEDLYETYGQGGTNEFVVLLVEGETTNTAAQITGTTTAQTYAGFSQGDFTNGGTNPVPIIDATTNLVTNVSLYQGYVPSIYLFCPNGAVYDIYDDLFFSAEAIHDFAINSLLADLIIPNKRVVGEPTTISANVASKSAPTYAWTFENGTPATASTESVNVTWNTPGPHNITLVVTNTTGGNVTKSATITLSVCAGGISTFPYVEDFENGIGCWDFQSANTVNTSSYFGTIQLTNGNTCAIMNSYSEADDYNQYLISPELHHTGELDLSFKYMKGNSNSTGEKFTVKYSTTNTDPASFTAIGNQVSANLTSWKNHSCTLPANAKYFMINYWANYQYYLFIDDIRIEANHENNGINDVNATNVKLYPNPTTGNLYIDAEGLQKVEIIDAAGRIVMTETSSSINMSHLANGVYTVRVMANGNSTIQKVVKK